MNMTEDSLSIFFFLVQPFFFEYLGRFLAFFKVFLVLFLELYMQKLLEIEEGGEWRLKKASQQRHTTKPFPNMHTYIFSSSLLTAYTIFLIVMLSLAYQGIYFSDNQILAKP